MMNESPPADGLDDAARRALDRLYGGRLPASGPVQAQCLHQLEHASGCWENWRVAVGADETVGLSATAPWISWTLQVHWPAQSDSGALLLSPDGCWPHCVNAEAAGIAAQLGVALAWFNRLELAHDPPDAVRRGPVFEHWPDSPAGALSVWAWGLQRCVDALLCTGRLRAGALGVVGHSRGGKAALLAGATDARIAATISHNSGTGGAASPGVPGEGAESLDALARRFPHWLRRGLVPTVMQGAPAQAPTDEPDEPAAAGGQPAVARHADTGLDPVPLWRAIAPRGLCLLQASDDAWAHPAGTRHSVERLRPTWSAHGAEPALRLLERTGGHAMTHLDWQRAAAFTREQAQRIGT